MPVLENPRHERFAQELAKGKTADEAYEAAGFGQHRGNASRLKGNESIAARVEELLGRAATRVEISKSWVLGKLVENANRALQQFPVLDKDGKETGEFRYEGSVANRALELVGKELGMFVDRKEIKHVDEFDTIDDPAELRRRLAAAAAELGAGDVATSLAGGAGEAGRKPH